MADPRPAVVLASRSPRRRRLLERLELDVEMRPADVDETARDGEPPEELVERLAAAKAGAIGATATELVVAADTVVVRDGHVLGKPADRDDAGAMLRSLSGRDHVVLTGVAVRRGDRCEVGRAATVVTFRTLTDDEIAWYVGTGEPDDKAGAYGLQGAGAVLVERVDGSDTNVIGLPLPLTVTLARRLGVDLLTGTVDAPARPGA